MLFRSRVGFIVPLYVNGALAPRHPASRAIAKWHQRGYIFMSRWVGRADDPAWGGPCPITHDEAYIGPDGCMHPDKERGSADNICFTLTYGTIGKPYNVGGSVFTSPWRVGWNFGGAWEGTLRHGTAFTFNCTTGQRIDIYPFITDFIELLPLNDVEV